MEGRSVKENGFVRRSEREDCLAGGTDRWGDSWRRKEEKLKRETVCAARLGLAVWWL